MNFEYKYEAGEQGVTLAGSGDLMDMVAHIARQAQIIHTRLRSRNAEAAASFRAHAGHALCGADKPRVGGRAERAAGDRLLQRHTRTIAGGI